MSKPLPSMNLRSFSGLPAAEPESRVTETKTPKTPELPEAPPSVEVKSPVEQSLTITPPAPARPKKKTIQTEVPHAQFAWLTETAALVRSNSTTPVPPSERCYPQHLITVAIELLKASPVNWSEVQSVEDLRQRLKL